MAILATPVLCRVVQVPDSSWRGCCPGLLRSPEGTSVRPGCRTALSTPPACQNSSHVDECVGDHPESDPPVHPFLTPIPAAVQPVPPLEHADPALTARPPFLPLAEPAFLLVLPARRAARRTILDRDPLHPQRLCLPFIFRRVKPGITGQQLGRPPQPLLMEVHRSQQQSRVGRSLPAHRIVRNNLILGGRAPFRIKTERRGVRSLHNCEADSLFSYNRLRLQG